MSGLPNNRTPKLGPWPLGVNNLAPEGNLPLNEYGTRPVSLREADNIDFTKEGWPRRRAGYTPVLSSTMAHSGWSCPGMRHGFFVDNGALKAFQPDGDPIDLATQVGNKPLSYTQVDGLTFFSNQDVCGVIDRNLVVRPWAVATPSGPPSVRAVDGYGMDKGQYLIALAYIDELGRESPLSQVAAITLADGQGIEMVFSEAFFGMAVIYATHANDQVLRRGSTIVSGPTYLMTTPANGMANTERVLAALPPGQITRYGSGRHWVATDNTLLWSLPLRPGVFDPELAYARFDTPITMVEFTGAGSGGAGIYVGTEDAVYWLDGADPAQFRKVDVYGHGVVRGTALYVPAKSLNMDGSDDVLLFTTRDGQHCVGNVSGQVTPLHTDRAAMDTAADGASLYMERNGLKQVVTSLKGARPNGMATMDKAVAHVIHREV